MKKLNNKGFSLVELIVVIAIMAILVGVLAPSVLGQLDKAKQAKDKQAMDAVASAVAYAYADQDITLNKPSSGNITITGFQFAASGASVTTSGTNNTSEFNAVVVNMIGYSTVVMESNLFKGKVPTINLNGTTGKVTVSCVDNNGGTYTVTK